MEHVKAMAIKAIMTLAVLYVVLGLGFEVGFGDIVALTLIIGIVSYLLGDLFVLPKSKNLIATLSDFGLSFLLIWIIGGMLIEQNISLITASLISALLIAAGEWFFHKYMVKHVLQEDDDNLGVYSH